MFCGLLTFTPVAVSILFSLYLCYKSEKKSHIITRVSTFLIALAGFYPQYLAGRYMFLLKMHYIYDSYLELIYSRTIMIGAGFLEGNWNDFKERSAKVQLIEPVIEGVLQLFFQYIILYIIYGPGTSSVYGKQISDFLMQIFHPLVFKVDLLIYHLYFLFLLMLISFF